MGFCVLERQSNGRYNQSALYCVKQKFVDGRWQGERGSRTLAEDAARYDRPIRSRPPSEEVEETTPAECSADNYVDLTFTPGQRSGFRCVTSNRVEGVIQGTLADEFGVMPGWHLWEIKGERVPQGGSKQAMLQAKHGNLPFSVKFRVPERL